MSSLQNPIWAALTTRQESFAEIRRTARKFPAAVTTLAGMSEPTGESLAALAELLQPGEITALFLGNAVPLPKNLVSVYELPLVQMMHDGSPCAAARRHEILELGPADVPEMVALAKLTEPGPFGTRTRELGTYIGIRRDGQLAAMAGERLKLPGHIEISAVCTHPDHTGHGYATALVAEMVARIAAQGERPILHSRANNMRALDVYRRLGFAVSQTFHLMVVKRA
jgi:ribosomal protein S18 acetylase RimI-like enzyme